MAEKFYKSWNFNTLELLLTEYKKLKEDRNRNSYQTAYFNIEFENMFDMSFHQSNGDFWMDNASTFKGKAVCNMGHISSDDILKIVNENQPVCWEVIGVEETVMRDFTMAKKMQDIIDL